MERKSVVSSNIASVGYDPSLEVLEIEFTSGGIYQYDGVSADLAADLVNADSIGRFFHSQIKPVFKFRKIAPPDAA